MPLQRFLRGAACALLALAVAVLPAVAAEPPSAERYYEMYLHGQKAGWLRVVWSPSVWKGEATVHDQTTIVQRESRNMAGYRDDFESTTTVDLERHADGSLLWQRTRVEEANRTLEEEMTWTGSGYQIEVRLGDSKETIRVPAERPAATDAEAHLGPILRGASVKSGDSFPLFLVDRRARRISEYRLEIVGEETMQVEGEAISGWKVHQTHLASGAQTRLWFDRDGVLLRLVGEGGTEIRRTSRAQAEQMPPRPAEYSVTLPAIPRLERVFSADRLVLEIVVQPDPDRPSPILPESPWSRLKATRGDDRSGWTLEVECIRHPETGVSLPLPLPVAGFEKALESTVLMPVGDPRLRQAALAAIGDARDAREAVTRLARFVYGGLDKRSPAVAQASALEILETGYGDCSEHALLFVALCRAAGIPARRCSGFVCVGSLWGSHAWAEVWVGEWIGVDPTTGEINPGARYLYFGSPDVVDSWPELVSSRLLGRMRILTRRVEEGPAAFDLSDEEGYHLAAQAGRSVLNVLNGLEVRAVPEGWRVVPVRETGLVCMAKEFVAELLAVAAQGMGPDERAGELDGEVRTTFGGAAALTYLESRGQVYEIFSRGRLVRLLIHKGTPAEVALLERALAPTFLEDPLPWPPEDAPR